LLLKTIAKHTSLSIHRDPNVHSAPRRFIAARRVSALSFDRFAKFNPSTTLASLRLRHIRMRSFRLFTLQQRGWQSICG
uniref:Integron gene cassette protein n=1 Tax=Ascaris lumbricoides TaxID=6252 RepID=A0A0M3IBF8_ASCLU